MALKLTVWVPTEEVRYLIGRNGSVVSKIQKETSAKLKVAPNEKSAWTGVQIIGNLESTFLAGKLVTECVEEIDDGVLDFELTEKQKEALLVDEKDLCEGAKRVSATHSVRIYISDDEKGSLEGDLAKLKVSYLALFDIANAEKKTEEEERRRLQFTLTVPVQKLSLFSAQRYSSRRPVHQLIARQTHTKITKLRPKDAKTRKKSEDNEDSPKQDKRRRRRPQAEDKDSCEEDDDDDDEDASLESKETTDNLPEKKSTDMSFVIKGLEANVNAAATAMRSIVEGEPIKEVIAALKKQFPSSRTKNTYPTQAAAAGAGAAAAEEEEEKTTPADAKAPTSSTTRRPHTTTHRKEKQSTPPPTPPEVPAADSKPAPQSTSRRRTRGRRRGAAPAPAADTNDENKKTSPPPSHDAPAAAAPAPPAKKSSS